MMKYVFGMGLLVFAVAAYFLFAPTTTPPTPALAPQPEPMATAPSAAQPVATTETPDDETVLEQIAADTRENLPSTVTDTLTWTDALFLPRMRIMEHRYVTTGTDTGSSTEELQDLTATSAETICLDRRDMFEMGTTLRNSLQHSNGNLIDRSYLLPEDCERFY